MYVQQGFTKVANTATYTAHDRDENNAVRELPAHPARPTLTAANPFIDGRTPADRPPPIAHPPSKELINVAAAFDVYRILTRQLAACPATAQLVSRPRGCR